MYIKLYNLINNLKDITMHNSLKNEASGLTLLTKLFFRMLPIQILLIAVGAVNGFVSSLFATNYVGSQAMSAVGVYGPVNMVLTTTSTVFMGGSQILAGKYIGMNQLKRARSVFIMDVLVVTGFSILAIIVLFIASAFDLTGFLVSETEVRIIFNRYVMGMLIGVLPLLLGQQLAAFLSLENQSKRTTVAGIVYIFVSILLNFVFVAKLKMEAYGLALASSLGLWVFFAIQAQYYLSGKSSLLKISCEKPLKSDVFDIVKTGLPCALDDGYQTLRGFIVNSLVLQYVGAIGLSAFAASNSVLQFFWAIVGGIGNVSRMLISISIGEEDRKTLTDVVRITIYRCLPLMCLVCALIIFLAEPFARLFFRDPSEPVYQMTVNAFRILPLCMPLSILKIPFANYAQASDKSILIHILSIADGVLFVAGFTALLIPLIGMNSVYIANVLNGICCIVIIYLYSWIVRKQFPVNMEQLMVIPDDFGVKEHERIDISVRHMDEVVNVSKQVIDFCHERNIDDRRSYLAGLFLEEMAGNIVEHGFNKDNKSHSIDIRVVHKNDDVILRLKDDCIPFDPAKRLEFYDPEDIIKGAGIRLVYQCAKDVQYQNTLGLNVLTIRI